MEFRPRVDRRGGIDTTDRLQGFMQYLKKGTAHDFDYVIIVDGPEGTGKSTLAMHMKMFYEGRYRLAHVLYDSKMLIKTMYTATPGKDCVVLDEAVLDFSNRTAMTTFQIRLIQAFSIARERRLVFILLIPNYNLLDPALKIRARYRIWVESHGFERGFAIVYYNMRGPFTKVKPWQDERWRYLFPMLPAKVLESYKKFKAKELLRTLIEMDQEMAAEEKRKKERALAVRGAKARLIVEHLDTNPKDTPEAIARAVGCSLKHVKDTLKVHRPEG